MKIKGKEIFIREIPKKAIKRALITITRMYLDIKADYYIVLQSLKREKKELPIRVGFIVQMPEIWDKEEPVYNCMRSDNRFKTLLIVVPQYDNVQKKILLDYNDNYFLMNYADNAICALENGKWIDINNRFDYVFFPRPYDHFLPPKLRSDNVVKHAKCCYIPYGFSGADVFNKGNTNKPFFRNMYFSFLESDQMVSLLRKQFFISKKIHHIENLGYPALSPFYNITANRRCESILWTPRWSFDEKFGGSTFLKNKNVLFLIAQQCAIKKISFRPHPLLFEELLSKNIMSQKEIDEYLQKMKRKGIDYDRGRPIYEVFKNTDVLITDFSTIIIQYFLTGKPIIYCEAGIKLNDLYSKMAEGFYTAKNEKDVLELVMQLQSGNDYLYEKRKEIIQKYLSAHKNSAERIVNRILTDAGRMSL